jgi:hypothetical protein
MHKCEKCGTSFSRKDNLKRHLGICKGDGLPSVPVEDYREVAKLILDGLPKRERLDVAPHKEGHLKPEVWVLQFSDFHYGQLVRPVEVGGLSEYSPEIAKQRLEYLASKVARILEYYPAKPKELVIAFLGDNVDGSIMRGNQQSNIEFGVIQQTMLASELLADFIVYLSQYFPRIRCYGVYGNHARLTKNPTDSHPAENFDKMVYYIISERIKGMKGITMEYTDSQHMIVRIGEKQFWLEHGDTVRSWMGIPFYGSQREQSRINAILAKFSEHADYMLLGHHHRRASFENIIFNGSFVGGDLFSIGRLRALSIPSQNLFGVNGKRGVVWERELELIPEYPKDKVRIYH